MKQIRKRLTYANVMSSIAIFLVLGGATAIAAKKIGKNQLKANAVTTAKIKRNAVTASKIRKNAITTNKIRNDAVTGTKVNEATLGEVPSAASATKATTATNLEGQTSYLIKLGIGQEQLVASHGAVSVLAKCDTNAGNDRLRLLGQSSADGAMMQGFTNFLGAGAGGFLGPATPEEERVLYSFEAPSGASRASFSLDRGWVLGPEAKLLGFNAEGTVLAVNFAGAACLAGGVINASG